MGIVQRQAIKGTIANYMGSVIGFITTFFIQARFLTEAEMGFVRVFVDAGTLFATLGILGATSSYIRYYPYFKDTEKKDHGFFFWSLVIPLFGLVLVATATFFFKDTVVNFFQAKSALFTDYYNYVALLGFFMLYILVFETNSNLLMRIVLPKFVREVLLRIILIAFYLLYGFRIISFSQFVIGYCTTYGIALLINILYMFSLKHVSLKPNISFLTKPLVKDFSFYTGFTIAATLGGAITPMINSAFLSASQGLAFTGIFAVAGYIANIIEIPYRSLGAITQPQISAAMKEKDIALANHWCRSVSLLQLIAGSLIFFFIWINVDIIFEILQRTSGKDFSGGKWVVFFLGVYKLLSSVFNVGITIISYSKYYYYSLLFTAFLTFCMIFLNLRFIPLWGMTGAAVANVIAYFLYFTLLLAFVGWKTKITPFSKKQIQMLLIIGSLFILNSLWFHLLSPLFNLFPIDNFISHLIDRLLCSILLLIIAFFSIYRLKLSVQVNELIRKVFSPLYLLFAPHKKSDYRK